MSKVPGSDSTYIEEIQSMKEAASRDFQTVFSEDQYARYEAMGVDPLEIQIQGNPVEEYIQKKLKEKGAGEGEE